MVLVKIYDGVWRARLIDAGLMYVHVTVGRGSCAHELLVGLHAYMPSLACSYYSHCGSSHGRRRRTKRTEAIQQCKHDRKVVSGVRGGVLFEVRESWGPCRRFEGDFASLLVY